MVIVPRPSPATSSPLKTARTPGAAVAAAVLIALIRACACGDRKKTAYAWPGKFTSSWYRVPALAAQQARILKPRNRLANAVLRYDRAPEKRQSSRRPGAGRDLWLKWAPAFAGVTVEACREVFRLSQGEA